MTQLPTITIGIPAHNEAENIAHLIGALLQQDVRSGVIEKIIVISDGSTDDTVAEVKKIADHRIQVIEGTEQVGQAERQNQIFTKSTTDVVILLNADVLPESNGCIEQMLLPFTTSDPADLVAARVQPVSGTKTWISRVLDRSSTWKRQVFENINNADNLYVCHGRARAFSRRLYTHLRWPTIMAEDAYSYIFAKKHGCKFVYTAQATILYSSPKTIDDHLKQSERFFYSAAELRKLPEVANDKNWYHIPRPLLFKAMLKECVIHPVYFISYCALLFLVSWSRLLQGSTKQVARWQPSVSTKTLTMEE